MNSILMPSLQRRALIKTVITVLNHVDVRAYFAAEMSMALGFIESIMQNKWEVVEGKVMEKVQLLPLPESLKNKVSAFIKPICLEVLQWRLYHEYHLGERYIKESSNEICWTPQGTIDKKKTAEAMVLDEKVDIVRRYEIACFYCLKNDILMLWNKMPENRRRLFCSEEGLSVQHPVVILWTYDVKGEMNRMEEFTMEKHECTPYQYALEGAVRDGNQVATEYILQKLTSEERETSLVRSAEMFCNRPIFRSCPFPPHISDRRVPVNDENADFLCFLLSQMNEEQHIELLKVYPSAVLSHLLHWPWQVFFMKMAKLVWAFLPTNVFYDLLKLFIQKVKDGFKDYDYQYLFREFWQQSPISYKECIVDICRHTVDIAHFPLLDLLDIKDKGNIKLILEDLTTPGREKVIFATCECLNYYDQMVSLEFFVQECLTTEDITIEFREFVKQKIVYCSKRRLENQKCTWSKVVQLLDNLTQKCDKRCVEDGNSSATKSFCSSNKWVTHHL